MKYLLSILIFCVISTPAFAIFGNRNKCSTVHATPVAVQIVPQVITQTKIIIPIRTETYSEVKGLRLLTDLQGQKFVEVNGQIINVNSTVNQVTNEIISNNKIIVEQITTF